MGAAPEYYQNPNPNTLEFRVWVILKCSPHLKKHPFTLLHVEFKAVMVLPTITHNYGNYRYGNCVGNALRR